DQKVVAFDYRGRNIGHTFRGAPHDVSLRHVAVAIRFDRKDMMVRVAAGDVEETRSGAVNRRGNELFCRSIDDPMQFAVVRVVAGHTFVPGEDHLSAARDVPDEGRAIAARVVFAWRLPKGSARRAVE